MANDRDELGDYMSGRAFGSGGNSVGGAMGEAEYWTEQQGKASNRRPFSPDQKYALVRVILGGVAGLWLYPRLPSGVGDGWTLGLSIAAGALVYWIASLRPIAFALRLAISVVAVICLVLIGATIFGIEGGIVPLLEQFVSFVVTPVVGFLGTL